VLETLGRAGEAEPLYRDVLAMVQRIFPGDHLDVATSLNNLAGVLETLGRAGEACAFMTQAAEMIVRLRGTDDARSREWCARRDRICSGGA
jgi:tetratricopeptide repeat protein